MSDTTGDTAEDIETPTDADATAALAETLDEEGNPTAEGDTSPEGDADAEQDGSDSISFESLATEFATGDGLSEGTIDKLTEALKGVFAGSTDEQVKGFILEHVEGRNAVQQRTIDGVLADVGGKAGYEKLTSWAASALPESEIEQYNAALAAAKTPEDYKAALSNLQSKFDARNGRAGKRASGSTAPIPTINPLRSRRELHALQADPRYRTDQKFRDAVRLRLAAGRDMGVYDTSVV